TQADRLAHPHGVVLHHAVGHVHHAEGGQREGLARHDAQREREGQHEEVARGGDVGHRFAHHALVVREVIGVDADVVDAHLDGLELAALRPTRREGAQVGAAEAGDLGELESAAVRGVPHAPTRFWPHTRTTWPFTAPAAGEARKAIASATSTGWPPCWREFRRRATSRVAKGMRAVMSVSMKPGATALAVPPCSASTGAVARTMPITPPLEAA